MFPSPYPRHTYKVSTTETAASTEIPKAAMSTVAAKAPDASADAPSLRPALSAAWRSLPDELKVQILETILTPDDGSHGGYLYNHAHFKRKLDDREATEEGQSSSHFLTAQESINIGSTCPFALLHGASEILTLAQEIFYGKNTFLVRRIPRYPRNMMAYPEQSINHFIQNLVIEVQPTIQDWRFVRKISRGKRGFGNLRHVGIYFNAKVDESLSRLMKFDSLARVMKKEPIIFNVPKLEVILLWSLPDGLRDDWRKDFDSRISDSIEPILWGCLKAGIVGSEHVSTRVFVKESNRFTEIRRVTSS
jgi:hypothetical protein